MASPYEPPEFARLIAHPLRWGLVTELARGDRRVGELASLLDEPQNLVSYHLRLLRAGDLVTARRSSFDGRDTYYHLDLNRCAAGLVATGAALHPSLTTSAPSSDRPIAVLFVCTGNSARSPIAAALLRHHAHPTATVVSAGTHPGREVHPSAVRVLRRRFGIDIASQRTQGVDAVMRQHFDCVITVCDKARDSCPELPGHPRRTHWSIPDPLAADTTGDTRAAVFDALTTDLDVRVRHLLTDLTTAP